MIANMGVLTIVFLCVLLVADLLSVFVAFDVLVKLMYRNHRTEWEAAGRPAGMFWRPPEVDGFAFMSGFAMQRLSFVWLFRTPVWIGGDAAAKRWLLWLRLSVLVWNAFIITLLVGFAHGWAFAVAVGMDRAGVVGLCEPVR